MTSKVTGAGVGDGEVQKNHCIFGYKQRLLSIEMKTKLVQHVESDRMRDDEDAACRE